MSKDTPEPLLSPLGDYRPIRAENASVEDGSDRGLSLQHIGDHRPTRTDNASPDAGTDAAFTLPPADPEAAPPPVMRHRFGQTTSTLAACGAHALLLFMLISAPPTEFGSGGSGEDAISVSIISASALDTRDPTAATSVQSAPAQVAPKDGDDVTDSAAVSEQSRPPEERKERQSTEDAVPDERLAAPVAPAPEIVPDEAPKLTSPPAPLEEAKVAALEPPPAPEPTKKEEPPTESDSPKPVPETRTEGGQTSIGAATEPSPQAAAASASRGEVFAYGLAVQSALLAVDQREARALVAASKIKGTVLVKLVLNGNGALARAEIVKSSGSPQLDEAALLLTRRATYPPPPPGLETSELAYIAPVRFR